MFKYLANKTKMSHKRLQAGVTMAIHLWPAADLSVRRGSGTKACDERGDKKGQEVCRGPQWAWPAQLTVGSLPEAWTPYDAQARDFRPVSALKGSVWSSMDRGKSQSTHLPPGLVVHLVPLIESLPCAGCSRLWHRAENPSQSPPPRTCGQSRRR